jgi:predicted transposase YdaD
LPQYEEYFDSGRLIRIYLDELQESSSLGLGMIQLVVEPEAKAGEKARDLMEQARVQVANAEAQEKILELIDKILVYKFPRLSRQELDNMFGLDDLRQTRYFQDVMQDGRLEAARESILRVLKVRFTNQPDDFIETLNKIDDLSSLNGLLEKAVTVKDVPEFKQALKEVTGNK